MKKIIIIFIFCFLISVNFAFTKYTFPELLGFNIRSCNETLINQPIFPGWNMISVPVEDPRLPYVSDIFPFLMRVYEYEDGEYVPVSNVELNKGYLVYSFIFQRSNFCGVPSWDNCFVLNPGWNLVGSYPEAKNLTELFLNPDEPSSLDIYTYDSRNNRYVLTDQLLPGKGHWIVNSYEEPITLCAKKEEVICVSNCTNITESGNYILCSDILAEDRNCIYVEADNVSFECNGYSMFGVGSTNAFYINNTKNSIFNNCYIENFHLGFAVEDSNNLSFKNNQIKDCEGGFIVDTLSETIEVYNNRVWRSTLSSPYDETKGYIILSRDSTVSNNKAENLTYGSWLFSIPEIGGEDIFPSRFIKNEFINNQVGIQIADGENIIFDSNVLCYNEAYDFYSPIPPYRFVSLGNICDIAVPEVSDLGHIVCTDPCP